MSLGKVAYEEFQYFWAPAVHTAKDQGAVDGPTWDQLDPTSRECWEQVAQAVITATRFEVKR